MLKHKRRVLFAALFFTVFFFISGGMLVYSYNKKKVSSPKTAKITRKVKKPKTVKPPVAKRARVKKKAVIAKKPKRKIAKVRRKTAVSRKTGVKRLAVKPSRSSAKRPRIAYTRADLDLLARLITAEAVAEPFSAKVAVGSVIVNRVKSSTFANSIRSVIYERLAGYYQFTPVLNGWINKPATADSKKAAYLALHGSDPSRGSLYYFDDSTKNTWLWSKSIKARIGKLVFAY